MSALKAHVHNGRLVLDIPTSLPEGTELELVLADGTEPMDDDERAALLASLDEGLADADAGRTKPAAEVLQALRR